MQQQAIMRLWEVCISDREVSNVLCADPAPASDAVLQQSLQGYPEFPAAAPPALPNLATGYRIGQRIPVGYQYEAAITQNAVFSLPVDPLSGFCTLGGLPVGFGVDAPHASSVRASICSFGLLTFPENLSHCREMSSLPSGPMRPDTTP